MRMRGCRQSTRASNDNNNLTPQPPPSNQQPQEAFGADDARSPRAMGPGPWRPWGAGSRPPGGGKDGRTTDCGSSSSSHGSSSSSSRALQGRGGRIRPRRRRLAARGVAVLATVLAVLLPVVWAPAPPSPLPAAAAMEGALGYRDEEPPGLRRLLLRGGSPEEETEEEEEDGNRKGEMQRRGNGWGDHEGKWSWERFGFTAKKPHPGGGQGEGGLESRAPRFDFVRFSLGNLCTPRESILRVSV